MNKPKCDELDYIHFLVAAQRVYSNVEAAKSHPAAATNGPAHDAYTRLLHRCQSDGEALWREVQPCVRRQDGYLVIDDTTLDKPYAQEMDLVTRHWSGKHRAVVEGINLISLLWTDGDAHWPCDFRLYAKAVDEQTKNDHFRTMLDTAHSRDFHPTLVAFDSWYASLANLKRVRQYDWHWLTQLKANRLVNLERSGHRPIRDVLIGQSGAIVQLKGYGLVKVFKTADRHGSVEHWATSDLTMTIWDLVEHVQAAWQIEVYHRGLKQFCGVERCAARKARAQRNHIGWAIRAFLRLEHHRISTGTSWFETKLEIIRPAIQQFLAGPKPLLRGFEQATGAHKLATA